MIKPLIYLLTNDKATYDGLAPDNKAKVKLVTDHEKAYCGPTSNRICYSIEPRETSDIPLG